MPKNLFRLSDEELSEARRLTAEANARLTFLERETSLFDHPGWALYTERLNNYLEEETKKLIACPVEEIPAVRAKVKLLRHLANLPQTLETELAQLRSGLMPEPEGDYDA